MTRPSHADVNNLWPTPGGVGASRWVCPPLCPLNARRLGAMIGLGPARARPEGIARRCALCAPTASDRGRIRSGASPLRSARRHASAHPRIQRAAALAHGFRPGRRLDRVPVAAVLRETPSRNRAAEPESRDPERTGRGRGFRVPFRPPCRARPTARADSIDRNQAMKSPEFPVRPGSKPCSLAPAELISYPLHRIGTK